MASENKQRVNLRLDPNRKAIIDEICKVEGITFTDFVEISMHKKIETYNQVLKLKKESKKE